MPPPIALFGGSFNPVHIGHVLVCTWLLQTRQCEQVWVIPSYDHPFDKELVSFEDRVRMCELALEFLGENAVVSQIEAELPRPSYSVRLVEALQERHHDAEFVWVMGSDLLDEVSTWHDAERFREMIEFLVVRRAGYEGADPDGSPEFPRVSSTQIRGRLAGGQTVEALIPASVREYIEEHSLYGPGDS